VIQEEMKLPELLMWTDNSPLEFTSGICPLKYMYSFPAVRLGGKVLLVLQNGL
jgi:hypothetical protein